MDYQDFFVCLDRDSTDRHVVRASSDAYGLEAAEAPIPLKVPRTSPGVARPDGPLGEGCSKRHLLGGVALGEVAGRERRSKPA